MSRLKEDLEVVLTNRKPGKVTARKRKNGKPIQVPVDSKRIDEKLSLRDRAKAANERIGQELRDFNEFLRQDKHYLRGGKVGDSFAKATEAFEDTGFLFTALDNLAEEQMDMLDDMNKWFGHNVAEGQDMESEFQDAEEETKGVDLLLENADLVKKDYMYVASAASRNMTKIFANLKHSAEAGVKQARVDAENHLKDIQQHKKDKRRLLIVGALHHHRSTKPQVVEEVEPPPPEVAPIETGAEEQSGVVTNEDAEEVNIAPSAKVAENDEDDEFADLLRQVNALQEEVSALKKAAKEDVVKVKMAEAGKEKVKQEFEDYKLMTENKELALRRQIAQKADQLVREAVRARERENEERAKFEAETFVAKSANRKGTEVAKIREEAMRAEIQGLKDKITKLTKVNEAQLVELEELREEVAKPKIEPEEYERVCQLQRETDDALAVLQQEFNQFKMDVQIEKKALEDKILQCQEATEKMRLEAQENLERALKAEKQIVVHEKEIEKLKQDLIEAEQEKIRAVAAEKERGEKLLAEQVEKTNIERDRADRAEAEVDRLEAEIEDLKIKHAAEVEKLENEIERLVLQVEVLSGFGDKIVDVAVTLTSKGGERCKTIINEHYRADKLKHYIEVGATLDNESELLDSTEADRSSTIAEIVHVGIDMTTAVKEDVEEYGITYAEYDALNARRDFIEMVESEPAVLQGLVTCPDSTQSIDGKISALKSQIRESRTKMSASAETKAPPLDEALDAAAVEVLVDSKAERAAARVQTRDAARRAEKEKAAALLRCLRADRDEGYAKADDLLPRLIQTTFLLHKLRYYLETAWDDEKDEADELVAQVHNLQSDHFVRTVVGECFDFASIDLKNGPLDALVDLMVKRHNLVRTIRLGSVDNPPLASKEKKCFHSSLKTVIEQIADTRKQMKSSIDDPPESFDRYFPYIGKLEHMQDMMGLIEGQDEDQKQSVTEEIEKISSNQQSILQDLQKDRLLRSKQRQEARNKSIEEKSGKTKALIASLELGIERRNAVLENDYQQIKVLQKTLSSYATLLQKLRVHAGTHGKVYERRKLVAAANKLELSSAAVFNTYGPSVDMRHVSAKVVDEMLNLQIRIYRGMAQLNIEDDPETRRTINTQLSEQTKAVHALKLSMFKVAGFPDTMSAAPRDITKPGIAVPEIDDDVAQHLQEELTLAESLIRELFGPDGGENSTQAKEDMSNTVLQLAQAIVKRRHALSADVFDFLDEEAKKPSPLLLERNALKKKLDLLVKEYDGSKEAWDAERSTLAASLATSEASLQATMEELAKLQATDIDSILANMTTERYGIATLMVKIEEATRALGRLVSPAGPKPVQPSKKIMWVVNRTRVQSQPADMEIREKDKSDLTPLITSADVQAILKNGEKCMSSLLKVKFEGGEGGGGRGVGRADAPDALPMDDVKGSLRIDRAGGKGRGQPGVLGKIEPSKSLQAVSHLRHAMVEQQQKMTIMEIELKAQTDQRHGFGELEMTEERIRKDKKFKGIKARSNIHNLHAGIKLERINSVLAEDSESIADNERAALIHLQSKLQGAVEKNNSIIERADKKREKNLLYALSALERVQLAAESIIGDLPSNKVLDKCFKKREELQYKLHGAHGTGQFPSLSGHGYPHLQVKVVQPQRHHEVTVSSPPVASKQTPPSTPFGSSAPRRSFTDKAQTERKAFETPSNKYIKKGLFIGEIRSEKMAKHIAKSKSALQLRTGLSPVAQRRNSPNAPPWFPMKPNKA
jgi:hypothetical protein